MEVGRVKLLGKVENLVCRILRSFSTVIRGGVTSTAKRGKYAVLVLVVLVRDSIQNGSRVWGFCDGRRVTNRKAV